MQLRADPEGPEADRCREVIVLTINGIASSLRDTVDRRLVAARIGVLGALRWDSTIRESRNGA